MGSETRYAHVSLISVIQPLHPPLYFLKALANQILCTAQVLMNPVCLLLPQSCFLENALYDER